VSSGSPGRPTKWLICVWQLYTWFNEDRIVERVAAGSVSISIRNSRPAPPHSWLMSGTLSQTVTFLDESGRAVAIAHRYLQPDGSLGASGEYDAKWLRRQGAVYVPLHGTGQTCAECSRWRSRAVRNR
jgi:hypothetical protein